MITSLNDHCNSIPSSQEPLLNNRKRRRNRLTEATARDIVYIHSNLKLLQKLQSLDYQEANVKLYVGGRPTFFNVFLRFFQISKKTWLFTFFCVVAHVFSNTGVSSPSGSPAAKSFDAFLGSQMTSPATENPACTLQVCHFTHFLRSRPIIFCLNFLRPHSRPPAALWPQFIKPPEPPISTPLGRLQQLSGTHYSKLFSVVTLLQFLSLG